MLKQVTNLTMLVFLLFVSLSAQTFYYYNGQKVDLTVVPHKYYLQTRAADVDVSRSGLVKEMVQKSKRISVPVSIKSLGKDRGELGFWSLVTSEADILEHKKAENVLYIAPVFETTTGQEAVLSNFIYIKLKDANDLAILNQLADKHFVEVVGNLKSMPLWFVLSCNKTSTGNALQVANALYETGVFAAVEPDLMTNDLNCVNDTYFDNQWNLKTTEQSNEIYGINLCLARSVTTGSPDVIVAVLDQGIQTGHPDISNFYSFSYDTETGTSPSQLLGEHGTACAGIIGAVTNNSTGIASIAPSSKLMDISNSLAGAPASRIARADGFIQASNNGASVISNSWGSSVPYSIIDDAILYAQQHGRNGKGTVVVFSAGNDNSSSVNYPANSNPDILAVGAMSPCGERKSHSSCDGEYWWGSNYGTSLDIVAPGVKIPTTSVGSEYVQDFNGTSSAAPHVAGIAALVLSVNPDLTQKQVVDIIELTAQKVSPNNIYTYSNTAGRPNGNWNNETGYGLLNADSAVKVAMQSVVPPPPPPPPSNTIVYNITGSSTSVIDTVNITPAGITVVINNPDYSHGAMISVRNMGLNDSIVVEWYGGYDQNNSACAYHSDDLFGNGAQISNFVSPKLVGDSVFITIRSVTSNTYTAEIKIYDWINGPGCQTAPLSKSRAVAKTKVAVASPSNWTSGAITVTYDGNETLTANGIGAMADYIPSDIGFSNAPWSGLLQSTIAKIIIEGGVTHIGQNAFKGFSARSIAVICSVETPPIVKDSAFGGACSDLYVPYDRINAYLDANGWKAFPYINPSMVNFDSQNDSPVDSVKVTYGGKITTRPQNPTRAGYDFAGWYKNVADTEAWNFDADVVTSNITLLAKWNSTTSVASSDRVIPHSKSANGAAAIAPTGKSAAEFTAGPNPAPRSSSGGVAFFRQGTLIISASLTVYDAAGNVVRTLSIRDNAVSSQSKRRVGSWDLKDANGRLVPGGTYLVKGTITASGGKSQSVSLLVGVR
ncbi:MAG: S8 family serine peptidase [Chitinispirillales bacterium]|jgi:uncharacterized repeat protein (TIGR02543 family)|nr:S8 family serine peptidase [Chitinispirillales bacterium]